MLDVMPTDESVLGFGNRWYDMAVRTAEPAYYCRVAGRYG